MSGAGADRANGTLSGPEVRWGLRHRRGKEAMEAGRGAVCGQKTRQVRLCGRGEEAGCA